MIAHLTLDESTAIAVSQPGEGARRVGFWVTGIGLLLAWNLATFAGVLGGNAMGDPKQYGLDAAASAAFIALLWPHLRARQPVAVAIIAAVITAMLVQAFPQGLPVLVAALGGALVTWFWPTATRQRSPKSSRP